MPKKKTDSMEEKLRSLGAKLDDLIAHARSTRDYAQKINLDEVLKQKAAIEAKLKELHGPAQDALREIRQGISNAWKDVKTSVSRARGKFKKKEK